METLGAERRLLRQINRKFKRNGHQNIPVAELRVRDDYYLRLLKAHRLVRTGDFEFRGLGPVAQSEPDSVQPTEAGLQFFAWKREAVKAFLLRSVVIPMVVSAVMTLITIYLQKTL
ncbi:hypothetical protein [Lacticaseibacillus mingshuiensis]|uniref:hypothetical protein n=1 Tax=Lacticaseibacillus mingshuiensis TaxID=2799574 RepID=UPI00194F3054|nr:hypothetical protein [Lacticaseibacillus mingshuiensis]